MLLAPGGTNYPLRNALCSWLYWRREEQEGAARESCCSRRYAPRAAAVRGCALSCRQLTPGAASCPAPRLQISAALAEVVQRHLGVPASRMYIKFYDVARCDCVGRPAGVSVACSSRTIPGLVMRGRHTPRGSPAAAYFLPALFNSGCLPYVSGPTLGGTAPPSEPRSRHSAGGQHVRRFPRRHAFHPAAAIGHTMHTNPDRVFC